MIRIAVLVSGGGTNLAALIEAERRGELAGGKLSLVVSSSATAYALERARAAGIDTAVVNSRDHGQDLDRALEDTLGGAEIDLVVLAGYLSILGPRVLQRFHRRIINVHPSLIPAFCGEGFYGLRVHRAALEYGVKITGATVHYVSGVVDGGEILLQKAVDVLPGDTPESLQRRVMEQAEWELLPQGVAMLCEEFNKERGMVRGKEKSTDQRIG